MVVMGCDTTAGLWQCPHHDGAHYMVWLTSSQKSVNATT
jgi:hypothetical protein